MCSKVSDCRPHTTPDAHLHLLDRLSVQHLDPRFFEVRFVGPSAGPVNSLAAERRFQVGAPEGEEHTLEDALHACKGRWIVLLDDQGLPEMDTLRRHLVAQLGSARPRW